MSGNRRRAGLFATALGLAASVSTPVFCAAAGSFEEASKPALELILQAQQIGQDTRTDVLSDPAALYSAICGTAGDALKAAREKRVEEGLKAIEPEIRPQFDALIQKYGLSVLDPKNYISDTFQSVSRVYSHQTNQAREVLSALSEVIEEAVLKRVALPDYSRIKDDLISRIEAEPGLDSDAKAELVRRVRRTEMVLPSRYIRDYVSTYDEYSPVVPLITSDQAWNDSDDSHGNRSAVIIYPGLLLAEIRSQDASPHLDYILAHETGHSIDSGRFPELYTPFIGCMKKKNKMDFKGWDEVLADKWASKVVAQRLLQMGSQAEKLDYLRKSYEVICDTPGEAGSILIGMITADHPSGQYRINNILGRDPDILKALGVYQQNSQKLACGL